MSTPLNKWVPESAPKILRCVGKTGEEAAELAKVTARITIQGIGGRDPATCKTNIEMLAEEIADVQAQCEVCIDTLGLDRQAIDARKARKIAQMAEWEAMFDTPADVFKPGDMVRYAHGPTALMLVEAVSLDHAGPGRHRYYGRQCMGGTVGAYEVTPATAADLIQWDLCNGGVKGGAA